MPSPATSWPSSPTLITHRRCEIRKRRASRPPGGRSQDEGFRPNVANAGSIRKGQSHGGAGTGSGAVMAVAAVQPYSVDAGHRPGRGDGDGGAGGQGGVVADAGVPASGCATAPRDRRGRPGEQGGRPIYGGRGCDHQPERQVLDLGAFGGAARTSRYQAGRGVGVRARGPRATAGRITPCGELVAPNRPAGDATDTGRGQTVLLAPAQPNAASLSRCRSGEFIVGGG